jgi:hypothetical protein
VLTIEEIANIYDFLDYDRKLLADGKNEILDSNASNRRTGIINSDILKVGQIQSKETLINIFNLHLQISLQIFSDRKVDSIRTITVSLGNLNTSGI